MKVNCGKSDVIVAVSQHNGLISTTRSKACVTGDERPQLQCVPQLYFYFIDNIHIVLSIQVVC